MESGKALAVNLQPGECNPAQILSIPPSLINSLVNTNPTSYPGQRAQPDSMVTSIAELIPNVVFLIEMIDFLTVAG